MRRFTGLLLFLGVGLLATGCEKFKGEPTLTPPSGWKEASFPPAKKVWVGPPANGFAPNINIVEEAYGGSLDKYVEGSIATAQKTLTNFQQLGKSDFTSTAGVKAVKLVSNNEQGGRMLRQTFYFFDNGPKKYIVTCTCLLPDGDRLAPTFEEAMKTFRFEK